MFHNKVVITFFSVLLFICGLFLLYTSNINKTLFVDVSAEHPFFIEDNQGKGIVIKKNSEEKYTVLLPSNFLYQTKTIHLKNTDNESINFKLYTEQKKDNNKEIEFVINIKNIKINGQNYNNKKQTVWYEHPYIGTVLADNRAVSLFIEYRTKFILRNVLVPQLVGSVILLLLSIFIILKCYLKEIKKIGLVIEKYGEWDMIIIQKYRNIDTVCKKTFWTVFILLNLVFLYYSVHFIYGDHDLVFVLHGMWGKVSWWNGRFTNYLPNQLLGGRFLPLITVSLALFGYSFTGILLAHYWKLEKTLFNYLVISLIIVLNPLVVYWLYYSIDVVSHLWLPSIMISALILSERKSYGYFFFAYLLFIFGLGIYASAVATISVVFFGKIFITYCFEKQSLLYLYQKFKRSFACIIISLISFALLIKIFTKIGLIPQKLADMKASVNLLGYSFESFFEIVLNSYSYLKRSVPFYDNNIILLLAGMSIISILTLCLYLKKYHSIKVFQLFFIIVGICLFPLAANSTEFVLANKVPVSRIVFYGYLFYGAFVITVLLKTKIIWAKNILILIMIFLLPMNVYRIVEAQKFWKIEFDYQHRTMQKVVENILDSPIKFNQPYTIVKFGEYTPFVQSFYKGQYNSYDISFLTDSIFISWAIGYSINMYIPQIMFNEVWDIPAADSFFVYGEERDRVKSIHNLLPYYDLLKNMRLLPSTNAILVQDNYIFINFDDEVLQKVLKSMEEIKLTELQ